MNKKLPFYQELISTNGPIVDRGNFTTQIGSNEYNINKNNNRLKKIKIDEKKADLQYELENYKAAKVFHDNNPLAFSRKKLPTVVPSTGREILNGLGARIENFYKIPQIGELNEFINPLHIVSSGIITPLAQAPLQAQEFDSLIPYGMAAVSIASTSPFVKPSASILKKGIQKTWNAPKKIGQVFRDIKYPENTIVKNGKLYHNSYDFLKENTFNKLTKEEINFLNTEAKDRGILEIQRRHPLNIMSELSRRGILAEDYRLKKVIKDYIPNILKGRQALESQYTMGKTRIDAFDHYLGKPMKNNPYRIHSNSFKNGNGLVYTIPENLINREGTTENLRRFSTRDYKDLVAIENYGKNPKEFGKDVLLDHFNIERTPSNTNQALSDLFKNGDYGKPIIKDTRTVIPSWDYITGTGGGAPFIKEGNKITMKDVWDIQPFSRSRKLPKFLQEFNANKILGGKDFTLNQTYRAYPNKIVQTFNFGGYINK